jgi:O-antigen ligase
VTESGQLVLTIPLVVCMIISGRERQLARPSHIAAALICFLTLLIFCWPHIVLGPAQHTAFFTVQAVSATTAFSLLISHSWFIFRSRKTHFRGVIGTTSPAFFFTFCLAAAVLFVVLLVNLKRGPWLGIAVSLLIFGLLRSRILSLIVTITSLVSLAFITPVRERALALVNDFFIPGGRGEMWLLGLELSSRFPLGIGPDNASYMQKLDPTLPFLHRHMHNNFLNVAVESGFLGLAAYLWWIAAALSLAYLLWSTLKSSSQLAYREASLLSLALGCSLLGWQVSGVVEYNFGDGEVRLLALFCLGLLLALTTMLNSDEQQINNKQSNCSLKQS